MATEAQVVSLLQASIDPKQHREAERALIEQDRQSRFAILLLDITASDAYPENTRLASALCFKNLVRRSWCDEDGHHLLPATDVGDIKSQVISLMVSSPPRIQAQLGDSITVIAKSDFPDRWTDLIASLVVLFSPDNLLTNRGVLQVAHSIFKPYRSLMRSDKLQMEINHVYDVFASPFLQLIQDIDSKIPQNETNKPVLEQLIACLDLSATVLYDLTIQDLSEEYEQNLPNLCQFLLKYLAYDNSLLHTDEDSESGPLESLKASILDVLALWVQQWRDIVTRGVDENTPNDNIRRFVEASWNLLTTLGPQTKYDLLANRALQFLTTLTPGLFKSNDAQIFDNDQNLSQIIERVILPNAALRQSDIELFEDEPIEFTRRDLEGGDSETRRRGATDFLRELVKQMQERTTQTVLQYVNHYLQEYSQDPSANWRSKDTAIYLFCAVAALGQVTAAQGVISTNPHVNIVDFFQQNLIQGLSSDSAHILLQVDTIKFLYIFRTQLTPQQWRDLFPPVIRHLGEQNYVLHTYSAVAVDRALRLTDDKGEPYISRDILKPVAKDIIQRLFSLIESNPVPEKVQENEFLMRCLLRVLITLREDNAQLSDLLATNFINILRLIRHNPSNPLFYYYFFEAIGALIRFSGPEQCKQLESKFYDTFMEILKENVQEFVPYVFQLFAALLEANPSSSLTEYYQSMIPIVLLPGPWEFKGNTPALVRLLCSLVQRGASNMVSSNQVEPTLGIFQKLISSRVNDIYGFDLLETILTSFPITVLQPYLANIFNLLLTRLSSSKTDRFAARFVRLYHLLSARTGDPSKQSNSSASNGTVPTAAATFSTDSVIAILDSVQKDVFQQIYPPIILPETQKFQNVLDRKIAVISLTKTLGDSEAFAERFAKGWARTVEALLALMVNPPVMTSAATESSSSTMVQEQDVESVSFGVTFTALNSIRHPPKDEFSEIGDLKTWIGQYLKDADQRHGGRIGKFIQERLSNETQQALVAYMQS